MRLRTSVIAGAVLGITMSLVPATGQATKAYVDYDRTADLSKYTTFAWADPPNGRNMEEDHPLLHMRVVTYINAKLRQGGLKMYPDDPDLYVTYYTSTSEQFRVDVMSNGYAYGPGWVWGGYWGYSPGAVAVGSSVTSFDKGTLVIDIWDARTKQLVWRGMMKGTVPKNPDKVSKMIYKGIDQIIARWQKMKKEVAKEQARSGKGD